MSWMDGCSDHELKAKLWEIFQEQGLKPTDRPNRWIMVAPQTLMAHATFTVDEIFEQADRLLDATFGTGKWHREIRTMAWEIERRQHGQKELWPASWFVHSKGKLRSYSPAVQRVSVSSMSRAELLRTPIGKLAERTELTVPLTSQVIIALKAIQHGKYGQGLSITLTLADLVKRTRQQLLLRPGMGEYRLVLLERWLAQFGIELKEE